MRESLRSHPSIIEPPTLPSIHLFIYLSHVMAQGLEEELWASLAAWALVIPCWDFLVEPSMSLKPSDWIMRGGTEAKKRELSMTACQAMSNSMGEAWVVGKSCEGEGRGGERRRSMMEEGQREWRKEGEESKRMR